MDHNVTVIITTEPNLELNVCIMSGRYIGMLCMPRDFRLP